MNKKSQIRFRKTLIFLIILISILSVVFVIAGEIGEIIEKYNSGTTLKLSEPPTLNIQTSSIESDIDFTITEVQKGKFRVDWAWKKDGDVISIKNNLTTCLNDGKTLASKCSGNLINSVDNLPLEKTREEITFDEIEQINKTAIITYVNPIYLNPKDTEICKLTIVNNLTCKDDLNITKTHAICSRLNKFDETICEPSKELEEPKCTTIPKEETIIIFERDFETFKDNTIFWNTYSYNSTCNLIELKKAIPNYISNLSKMPVNNSNVLINSTFDFRNDSGSFTFDVPYSSLFGEYKISGKLFDLGFGTATFTLNNQGDNIWTNNNTPAFNFTLKGSNLSYDIQLFMNNVGYGVVNALNNTPTVITANASLPDGLYTWYLNATNGTTDQSAIRNITIDTSIPTLTVSSPINSSNYNSSSVLFNVSSSEEGTGSIIPDIDNSLVSWWRMDDVNATTGVIDYMGRNNGTRKGNATQTTAGKMGKGFSFDGIDGNYVNIGNKADFNFTNTTDFTLSAWVYMYSKTNQNFIRKRTNLEGMYSLDYTSGSQTWEIYISDGSGSGGDYAYVQYADANPTNKWVHLVGVYNSTGKNVSLYVNGVNSYSYGNRGNVNLDDFSNADSLTISSNTYYPVNGTIDDVMIFNRSLSADEILSIYNATKYQHTQSNLTDGAHTFKAYTQDLAGNMNNSGLIQFNVSTTGDTVYPVFSDYYDDNASLTDTGIGHFNVSVANTNGTVILHINGTDIIATNLTSNVYNASTNFTNSGTYTYRWHSWGNGSSNNYNKSIDRFYTVNASVVTYSINITQSFTSTSLTSRTGSLKRDTSQSFLFSLLISRIGSLKRNILQTFTNSFLTKRLTSLNRGISQFFTNNFIMSRLYSSTRGISQTFLETFSISRISSLSRNTFQSFISLFYVNRAYSGTRGISQFFTNNFITSRLYLGTRSIFQSFTSLFSVNKFTTFPKSVNQLFTPTFIVNRAYTGLRNTIFTPSLNFITTRLTLLNRGISQTFTSLFSVTSIKTTFGLYLRNIVQLFTGLFNVDTTYSGTRGISQFFTDNFIVSRLYSGTRGIYQSFISLFSIDRTYSGTRSITQLFTNNFFINRIYSGTRSIFQSFIYLFSVSKSATFPKSISQSFSPTFIINRAYTGFRSITQSFQMILSVARTITTTFITYTRNIFQSFSSNFIIKRTGSFFRNIFQGINMLFIYLKEITGIIEVSLPSNPPQTSSVTYQNISNKTQEINKTKEKEENFVDKTKDIVENIGEIMKKLGLRYLLIGIFSVLLLILAVFFDKCTKLMSKDKIIFIMVLVIISVFFVVLSIFYESIYILSLLTSIISISIIMLILVFSILIDKTKKGKV